MLMLIDYDRKRGRIAEVQRLDKSQRAYAHEYRVRKSVEYMQAGTMGDHEVVILEAPTEDHIRRSHARYFQTLEELVASAA